MFIVYGLIIVAVIGVAVILTMSRWVGPRNKRNDPPSTLR